MSLTFPLLVPVTHSPNKALKGLMGKSQQKATGRAEDKVRKENQRGGGAASKHGQTGKLDVKPRVWQQ